MQTARNGDRIRVQTDAVAWEWDLARGGQLGCCELLGEGSQHALFSDAPAPDLTLAIDGKTESVSARPAAATIEREEDGVLVFVTRGRLGDCFEVQQRFEVFAEGAVFCEFSIVLDAERAVTVDAARLGFGLAVLGAKNMRGLTVGRDPFPKQDVTTLHVLSDARVCIDRDARVDAPHLLAVYGLDLGWDEARYYSNRVEMVIEDSTSIGQGMLGRTRTLAGPGPGCWELSWHLCADGPQQLTAPFFYRNRWALLCGCARTRAGAGASRARRHNAMAARVCHVMYPYVRGGDDWPWCSVPVRQTFYQDAQTAAGNPELVRLDEAAALGCNLCVIHQFWMTNGGSNGEPMAEYRAHDPDWLRAFVDRAHDLDMRVAFYVRGIERYNVYSDFFERYLVRGYDGLYVDWATPFALGYCKTSQLHFSAYDYFMFTRALRRRVGDDGILIAHSAIQTFLATAVFDAVLVGEFSVMHSGLLASPETSASYAMLGGCGVSLIAGNSPDRALFSSRQAAAYCAGLGYSAHPFMEEGKSFAAASAYLHALWRLWSVLDAAPTRLWNPATGTGGALRWSDAALHPLVYQAADGSALLTVANLSDATVSGTVDVDVARLGLAAGARFEPVSLPGTETLRPVGARVHCDAMPAYSFGGVLARILPEPPVP